MISLEQRFRVLTALGENTDWDSLNPESLNNAVVIGPAAQEAGRQFTQFLSAGAKVQIQNFFRLVEDLSILIPSLPRPTLEELQSKFDWIKKIERDASPTGAVQLRLGTVLGSDEEAISGKEYERRRVPLAGHLHGYQQLVWLVEHQDEHPNFKALPGQIYIDGPGLIVVGADGRRRFPYLRQGDERWDLRWGWTGSKLDRYGRVAVHGK